MKKPPIHLLIKLPAALQQEGKWEMPLHSCFPSYLSNCMISDSNDWILLIWMQIEHQVTLMFCRWILMVCPFHGKGIIIFMKLDLISSATFRSLLKWYFIITIARLWPVFVRIVDGNITVVLKIIQPPCFSLWLL